MLKKRIIVTAAQVPFIQGGAELQVSSLVHHFKEAGFDADLVQLPFCWYPEASLYDSMLAWRLLDLSESNGKKIDLVIGTKFPSYGIRHENKVSWVIHQFRQVYDLYETEYGYSRMPNGEVMKRKVERFDEICLRESKAIYTDSGNVSDRMRSYCGIDSKPLYHPPSMVGRYKEGEYGDYVFSVGRLDQLKRNDLLIKAAPHLEKGIKVLIAGEGSEKEHLQKIIRQYKVEDKVSLIGFVSNEKLLEYYANSFAVFYAPIDEDYGYITLEAFLSKKPVVTCKDSGGVLEFVQNEVNGYVCDVEPEDLGRKINLLYQDKKRSRIYGTEGYQRVKDITWENVVKTLTKTL